MENFKLISKTPEEAVKEINKLRLSNKNRWFCFNGRVNNKEVKAKVFNTWLQIFLIDDKNGSNPMDQTPGQFKQHILTHLEL
jgi:hypothetical protein